MISRFVRMKYGIPRIIVAAASDVTNSKLTRKFSTLQKIYLSRGYVADTGYGNLNFNYKNNRLKSGAAFYSSKNKKNYEPELELNSVQFEKISNDTLESLTEYFDELIEQAAHLTDADVSYGDGVLTVKFGKEEGTYVINRQTPNKQIWLSSPKSGPKRYDFVDGKWIYKRDGKSLHDLLNKEIPALIRNQASFERCSYSGMEQYSDRGRRNSTPD